MGYERIALGGLVAQKSHEILAVLQAVADIRDVGTRLHLLGVTRCEHIPEFASYGVASFDSTSPFRQAFKDDRDNYYADDRTYLALRVPQADGNTKLQRRIRAGEIDGRQARELEHGALEVLRLFDAGAASVDEAVSALRAYEEIHDEGRDRSPQYREVLEAAPWQSCECAVCRHASIEVIIFRGTERNKRRGFHNLQVFARRLTRQLRTAEPLISTGAR